MVLLVPFMVSYLGTARFGIWALISVLTGYFGLFDFGVGTSFVKYISEYYAKKEYDKINAIVNTGFIFYLFLGMVILGILMLVMNPLLSFLNIPSELHEEASFVFIVGILLFGISNAVSSFEALQAGLQRMDITNIITIIISIPNIAGTIILLKKGYGLRGLIINSAIFTVLTAIINIIVAYKLFPELKCSIAFFYKNMMKKLFNFGYKVEIAVISVVVTTQTDKLLITIILSVALVTYYQLGNAIVQAILSITALLVSALMPAFSEMEARGERQLLLIGYLRMTKYLAFVSIPLFIFVMIFAPEIMNIWMGPGYQKSVFIIQILSIGWLFNKLAHVGATVSMAIGKPQLMAKSSIIIIVLDICLSVFLIKLFGFYGVAWGTSIAVVVGTIYFQIMLHKHLDLALMKLINETVPSLIISIIATAIIFAASITINSVFFPANRLTTFVILLSKALIFGIIYIIAAYYARIFDSVDVDLFAKRIPYFQMLVKE